MTRLMSRQVTEIIPAAEADELVATMMARCEI